MKYILLLLDILFYFYKKLNAWLSPKWEKRRGLDIRIIDVTLKLKKKNVFDINEIECLDSFIQCRV